MRTHMVYALRLKTGANALKSCIDDASVGRRGNEAC